MSQPGYRLPPQFIFKVLTAILLRQKRSFRNDAFLALSSNHPPIQVKGRENIPTSAPCMVLMNHYSRPGYIPIWSAFALASLMPMDSRWLMTSTWTSPNRFWDPFKRRLTSIFFSAICRVYGFIPMPPDPREVAQRANAVRRLMSLARQRLPIAIGLAPEGRDFPQAMLGWPPPGMGRLLEQLSKFIPLMIPVGVYEADDRQVLHFGNPITLEFRQYADNEDKDQHLSAQLMGAIAALLPPPLRGEFR